MDSKAVNGIPSKSNGEYGFIVWSHNSPHKLAVYARASHKWHVRIVETDFPDLELMEPSQLNKKGIPKFYKIKELDDGTGSIEEVLEMIQKWMG